MAGVLSRTGLSVRQADRQAVEFAPTLHRHLRRLQCLHDRRSAARVVRRAPRLRALLLLQLQAVPLGDLLQALELALLDLARAALSDELVAEEHARLRLLDLVLDALRAVFYEVDGVEGDLEGLVPLRVLVVLLAYEGQLPGFVLRLHFFDELTWLITAELGGLDLQPGVVD